MAKENATSSIKNQLETLNNLDDNQLNTEAVKLSANDIASSLQALLQINDIELENDESVQQDANLELLVDVFLKFRMWRDSVDRTEGVEQPIHAAYDLLLDALIVCTDYWTNVSRKAEDLNVVVYLLQDLRSASHLAEIEADESSITKSRSALLVIKNILLHCPDAVGTLNQHNARDVFVRYFASTAYIMQYLSVLAFCLIDEDPNGDEVTFPDEFAERTIAAIRASLADSESSSFTTTELLQELDQLMDCNHKLGQMMIEKGVLDLLQAILEAPAAKQGWNAVRYMRKKLEGENEVDLDSSLAEKRCAIDVCLSLTVGKSMSENIQKITEHRLMAAVEKVTEDESLEKCWESVENMIWRINMSLADGAKKQTPQETSATTSRAASASSQSQLLSRARQEPNRLPSASLAASPSPPVALSLPKQPSRPATATEEKKQVLISYSTGYKPKFVGHINIALNQRKVQTWIESVHMVGKRLECFGKAIDESAVVLVCYSESYRVTKIDSLVLDYASREGKQIVPVLLQNITPKTHHTLSFQDRKPVDFSPAVSDEGDAIGDMGFFDSRMNVLEREINDAFESWRQEKSSAAQKAK